MFFKKRNKEVDNNESPDVEQAAAIEPSGGAGQADTAADVEPTAPAADSTTEPVAPEPTAAVAADDDTEQPIAPEQTAAATTDTAPTDLPAFVPLTAGGPLHALPKQRRSLKWLWISLLIIFGLLLVVYGVGAYFFSAHFGFNSTVNSTNVSYKTVADVQEIVASQVDQYQLQIDGRGGSINYISGVQIDMEYVPDNQVQQLLTEQNFWLWPLRLLVDPKSISEPTHASVSLNQGKLDELVGQLAIMDPAKMQKPEDAKLVFLNGRYTVQPENAGTELDVDKAKQLISQAALSTEKLVDLDKEGCYSDPKIFSTDETLRVNMERFNKFVPFSITYVMGETREVLDGNTTINWVNATGDGPYELDYGQVAAWVADFAARHNTVGATRPIKNGFGEDKTVTGGTYGWELNQEAEINAIFAAAANRTGEERAPYTWSSAASLGIPDWGTTYAEVDFTAQHMWYFKDGVLAMESDVVTGTPDGRHNTTEGVFYILEKKSPAVLRGPRIAGGSYEWEANVSFWMAVTLDGIGFHDATWQPRFGGDWYVNNGSHGCINMPYNAARDLYALIEDGTPVVMHF